MAWPALLLGSAVASTFFGGFLAVHLLTTAFWIKPWDGNPKRRHDYAPTAPKFIFWWSSWFMKAVEMIQSLKPAPMRVAELATSFTTSQVMFALVNLGVPDLLAEHGPMSAVQLAAAINAQSAKAGTPRQVPALWLDRLLTAAAALGMLVMTNSKKQQERDNQLLVSVHKEAGEAKSRDSSGPGTPTARITVPASAPGTQTSGKVYSLNAVTAALVSTSPVSMTSFVKLLEDDYAAMTYLSKGIESGTVPFRLWSNGQSFWDHLSQNERHAATFDVGMLQKRHIGGAALVTGYPWGKFDTIVDVAGGVGTFTADLLAEHPKLKGIVLDQVQQIERGKQIWAEKFSELLPRAVLVAGDIFNSKLIPAPPADSANTAYVLYDILHNWPAANCLAILTSIREAVARAAGTGKVRLLLLEVTKCEEVLPCHLPFRCGSDIAMMTLFGDGCERDTNQFKQLLSAAGWKLEKVVPTNGIFMVIEASPN
eukprot:gene13986-14101_t